MVGVVIGEGGDGSVDPEVIARVAGLDVGKAEVVCCTRLPGPRGRGRVQQVRSCSTMTASLLALGEELRAARVTRVVMEATGDYWRAPFYVLESLLPEVWLVNAKDVKHLPGRPKTDRLDAVWLAKLAERQMLRPSFVPPPPIRRLRDLTRYRSALTAERTAQKNRVEKVLEDAQIKVSVVATDIFGVSGRAMMAALIAGERDPAVLAGLARAQLRRKIGPLEEAFTGRFTDHHAFLLDRMLRRIDTLSADIADLDIRIEGEVAPFAAQVAVLDEIAGVGPRIARVLIAEIGVDMTRFPTPGHLTSWARMAPRTRESAHRTKGNASTGNGDRYLAAALGEAAMAAGRTPTFLGERYRRLARRRGKQRAIVATARAILVRAWYLLSDPDAGYHELGADYHERRRPPSRQVQAHLAGLHALGYRVTLERAA